MYLKTLEIQGFKSFPERTVISFDRGVTAIIGPNGSGKSNVTDAIRWVLGEQSIKTLRGSRMEDVIFSGTQSRRAMSFAEVTMVIDNADGRLPVDYAQIQLTRRLYRSGESEYLLNKSRCRLRDIQQLFMDTGLGRDGYSIVGQGRVDEILSNRSEDRRRIFEEASGIVKYKTRKEESERKLESTRLNLIRLEDLIQELDSRLDPLREQAEVARQYLSLTDSLKSSEIALVLDVVDQQQARRQEAEQALQLALADLAEANSKLAVVRGEQQETAERLQVLDGQSRQLGDESNAVRQQVHDVQQQQALSEQHSRHLAEQIRLAAHEAQELTGSLDELDQELEARQARLQTLQGQKEHYQGGLAGAEADMAALMQTLDASEKRIEADKAALDQALDQLFDSRSDRAKAQSEAELLEGRLKTLGRQLLEQVSELDRLRLQEEEKQAARRANHQARQQKDQAAQGLDQDLQTARSQASQARSRLQDSSQDLRNKSYRVQTLEKLEQSYEGYQQAVRTLLKKADQDPAFGRGIRGTVGSLLRTSQRFERAIETALGPAVQNLVTDTQQTASRLIETLKADRSGRATFLPLDTLQARRLSADALAAVQDQAGFLGLASDCVTVAPDLRVVVGHLLGRVLIAQDLQAAMRLSRLTGQRLRLVTLDGDVINPGGSMTGGSAQAARSGLLGRHRETAALKEACHTLKGDIERQQADLQALESRLDQLEDARLTLESDRVALSHEQVRLEAQAAALADAFHTAESQRAFLVQEDARLQTQLQDKIGEEAAAGQRIDQLQAQVQALRSSIETGEAASAKERQRRDDLREAISHWRVSLQSVQETLDGVQALIDRLTLDRSGRQERLADRRQAQSDHRSTIEAIEQAQSDAQETLVTLQAREEALHTRTRALMQEKDALESRQAGFFDQLETASSHIAGLQGDISRIEGRLSRADSQVDDAKNRLWELYELTVDQAAPWKQEAINRTALARQVEALKAQIRALGPVHVGAVDELAAVEERHRFLTGQRDDIQAAGRALQTVIQDLTRAMKTQFLDQFTLINQAFERVFAELFGGGTAELSLEDADDVLHSGIEIKAQPPGKRLQNLMLLSGGERCLTAIALLFAILKLRPTPFCVLDEVDSSLDDANVIRFTRYIQKVSQAAQFILVTHRKGTMEAADRLYGVTMPERGISHILSMALSD